MASRPAFAKLYRDVRSSVGLMLAGVAVGGGAFLLFADNRSDMSVMRPRAMLIDDQVHYRTCRDALLDGFSNIARGEPGYRSALDADDDGLACEPYVPVSRG